MFAHAHMLEKKLIWKLRLWHLYITPTYMYIGTFIYKIVVPVHCLLVFVSIQVYIIWMDFLKCRYQYYELQCEVSDIKPRHVIISLLLHAWTILSRNFISKRQKLSALEFWHFSDWYIACMWILKKLVSWLNLCSSKR